MGIIEEDISHILTHTRHLWYELRNKKLFLTGGTGLLGKWILHSFIAANREFKLNAQLTVFSRDPDLFLAKYPLFSNLESVYFCRGNVLDNNFPEGKFDYVIHAATDASALLNVENPLLMLDTIVQGTLNALKFAKSSNASRFLLVSSGAVYGKQPKSILQITEDYSGAPDTLDPTTAYGQGKRIAELLCSIYHKKYGLETMIARCFAFVGPYLDLNIHFAVGNFIRDAIQNKEIDILGDGTPLRSYLYTADWAIWIWTILFNGSSCRAYNVGSDSQISISDLALKVCEIVNQKSKVRIAQKPQPNLLPEYYIPSVERAKSELGLKILIGLDQALCRTIKFYQS